MIQFFIDIDGVILDFDASFVKVINRLFDKQLSSDFCPNDWSWTEHPVNISRGQSDFAYSVFLQDRSFKSLKTYPTSLDFLASIKKQQHHIDLITNMPHDHVDDRILCLKNHKIPYDRFFNASVKSQCINLNKLKTASKIVFVDDNHHNCEDVLRNCPQTEVFIIDKPHNRHYDKIKRLNSLSHLKLSDLIAREFS